MSDIFALVILPPNAFVVLSFWFRAFSWFYNPRTEIDSAVAAALLIQACSFNSPMHVNAVQGFGQTALL